MSARQVLKRSLAELEGRVARGDGGAGGAGTAGVGGAGGVGGVGHAPYDARAARSVSPMPAAAGVGLAPYDARAARSVSPMPAAAAWRAGAAGAAPQLVGRGAPPGMMPRSASQEPVVLAPRYYLNYILLLLSN